MIENFESKFLAFARSKPKSEEYQDASISRCALGQFVISVGFKSGNEAYYATERRESPIYYPAKIRKSALGSEEVLNNRSLFPDFFTFGTLVTRLEAAGVV